MYVKHFQLISLYYGTSVASVNLDLIYQKLPYLSKDLLSLAYIHRFKIPLIGRLINALVSAVNSCVVFSHARTLFDRPDHLGDN